MSITRPTTDAEAFAQEAQRATETTARELEQLANRLRQLAQGFGNPSIPAVGLAADIASEYVQGVGARGTRLWSLVDSAGKADRAREGKQP